jgi:hypothetical protein
MPNDIKAALSAITLDVAWLLAHWSGSPVRPEYGNFVMGTAVFMVLAMWIFPETDGKKRGTK